MKSRFYLLIALAAFVVAVTGSDVFARMTIAGDSFAAAIAGHLKWLSLTLIGVVILMVPFAGVALICAAASSKARDRSVIAIFAVSLAALAGFYFDGFQTSQQAVLLQYWTGATLSIGLLPFLIGLPLLALTLVAAAIATFADRRPAA